MFLLINHNSIQYRYYTGISVKPSEWEKKKKDPVFKSLMADFEARTTEVFYKLIKLNTLDQKTVINCLKEEFSNNLQSENFIDYMIAFIESKKYKRNTEDTYLYVVKFVKNYEAYKRKSFVIGEIDNAWIDDFRYYMEHVKGYKVNSLYVTFAFLKSVLRVAYYDKLIPYRIEIKNPKEEIKQVYLSSSELEHFYSFKQPTRRRQEYVDAFLVMCYTCLRMSDYKNLRVENIKGNKIFMPTKKTSEFVVIPLHKMVSTIIEKYNGRLPDAGSHQNFNMYIKLAAKDAGFHDSVVSGAKKKGEYKAVIKEKWEMISAHTARRSGATNMYIAGIPTLRIMKITGHKSESAFMKYICIGDDENADELLQHAFFK